MSFIRRWTLSDQTSSANNTTRLEIERPELEIIADGLNEHRVRKRDLSTSTSSTDRLGSNLPKRRRTTSEPFSLRNFLFNPVKTMYWLISGEDQEADNPTSGFSSEVLEVEASTSANVPSKNQSPVIDLTGDSDDQNASEDGLEPDMSSVFVPDVNLQLDLRRRPEESKLLGSNEGENAEDVVCIGYNSSPSSVEKQDECEDVVQFTREVELQEEDDDVQIIAEICYSPEETLLANRISVESAREQVTLLSSSIGSPAPSNSSLSAMEGRNHDQVSISSPTPEDSISRQGTPYGLRFGSFLNNEGDPWKRRRPRIQKSKFSDPSNMTALERSFNRIRDESGTHSGVTTSNVNLAARDYLLDMVVKMGGNKVIYPTASNSSSFKPVDKRKPFRKTKRTIDGYDGIRRIRSALNKCLQESPVKNNPGEQSVAKDLDKSFERQSSSEQQSEDGNNSGEDARISSNSEIQSSRSMTPASTLSSGVDRITELLDKMNNLGRRPTPVQQLDRFVTERRDMRRREIELKEELRVRNAARQSSRGAIEEQARRRLQLIGICVPKPKPRIKDEFPPLSDQALSLCLYIWDKRLPESEEFSHAFGIKLTRRDLSTLSGLDWLNDSVINFYLQLVCQRSVDAKDLPKVYAFNTFFYTNISTRGYDSVRRWTRKVDIFSYDMLLVPIHLSVHWCLAVIDLTEKRIDYYDSLLGRNQKCLDNLKNYLTEECKDKKKQSFDFKGWEFNLRMDIPRQMNGSDCGVFACKFAEFASRRAPLVFTQDNIQYYRRRMVYELVKKELL